MFFLVYCDLSAWNAEKFHCKMCTSLRGSLSHVPARKKRNTHTKYTVSFHGCGVELGLGVYHGSVIWTRWGHRSPCQTPHSTYQTFDVPVYICTRDGKKPNPARTNQTRTQVLPRTEMNPILKLKNVQEPRPNRTQTEPNPVFPVENQRDPDAKCHGSYSVLSLNETVGTFPHFTVNEAFYFT